MCIFWPCLLPVLPALLLAVEDFRYREVSILWLSLFACGTLATGWLHVGMWGMLSHIVSNVAVLGVTTVLSCLYYGLRGRSLLQFFKHDFGAGDAVMLFAMTPLFGPQGYVRFLCAAGCSGLVWWAITRAQTIPLVGIMSLVLTGYFTCKIAGLWN